ncbi:hypothetical protein [Trinickia soli]|uniref:Uncharacterized protein n=1 Tax=Trinickia soli TaxID=380675 RepID=A0A2N7W6G2_9BURK|nr:hypothetical protein [Trinickia soli]KAA0081479.1 hypothetical protein CIW54_21895 [Paraburkholderia sp. T12-10]PMS24984.1 hypothetical protein C0Z19_11755 [Trinickia soli]CAB3646739.1 hypothetical protein LMG24076_00705 [Trinickia soli]
MPKFEIKDGMLMGSTGRPLVADEVDIPSPHTRAYQDIEARIHEMSDRQVEDYAESLRHKIHVFDQHDTLEEARAGGRLAYRSWPMSPTADQDIIGKGGKYVSGFSSLSTTRDAVALRQAQRDFRQGTQPDPFTSAPSTILGRDPDRAEALWSGSGPGMVTTLLPEDHYVALEALNRRVQQSDASFKLAELNDTLRAEVTRPHLLDNKDLSSMVMTLGTETERRGKPSARTQNPASDFKLRENATRYQSFMNAHGAEQTEIHNEMAVHYRQTGHSTPAIEMTLQEPPKTSLFDKVAATFKKAALAFAPENPTRDTATLGTQLNTNRTYPVRKK